MLSGQEDRSGQERREGYSVDKIGVDKIGGRDALRRREGCLE